MSEYFRHDFADFSGTATANNTTVAPSALDKDGLQAFDCRHFGTILVQVSGTFTATYSFQFSNDGGTTWSSSTGMYLTALSTNSAISGGAPGIWIVPVVGKAFRLQCTAYTSGTIVAKCIGTTNAPAFYNPGTSNVQIVPSASAGAATHAHIVSAASTNSTSVKGSATSVNTIVLSNNGAGVAYFKIYNQVAAPTVGTDVPVATILIPINGTVVIPGSQGMRYATGFGYAITGGAAVADTTAVGAAQVVGTINYT
jgi:hypothetical protein